MFSGINSDRSDGAVAYDGSHWRYRLNSDTGDIVNDYLGYGGGALEDLLKVFTLISDPASRMKE